MDGRMKILGGVDDLGGLDGGQQGMVHRLDGRAVDNLGRPRPQDEDDDQDQHAAIEIGPGACHWSLNFPTMAIT